MPDFKSTLSYSQFAWRVRTKARYVFDKDTTKFIRTVLTTSKGRRKTLPKGMILYRAQYGHDWQTIKQDSVEFEVHAPHPESRMMPLKDSAIEGRGNPKGIPTLYLATDMNTAMAEVRPWLGSYISVGQFKTLKDVELIDCSVHHRSGLKIYLRTPTRRERERAVWAAIDRAFSEPVEHTETSADYAPTQILAEAFRQEGYEGIVYKSLLGKGFNVALFDTEVADLMNCRLFKVKSLSFKFTEAGNPYYVSKHYKPSGKS